jgi:hypothetical protein
MSMRAWAAGVFAVGAIGYVGSHKGDDPQPLPDPSYQSDQLAPGDVPKTASMSDQEWCVRNSQNWESKGAVVPDEWDCQGEPMSFWRGQQQKRWKS